MKNVKIIENITIIQKFKLVKNSKNNEKLRNMKNARNIKNIVYKMKTQKWKAWKNIVKHWNDCKIENAKIWKLLKCRLAYIGAGAGKSLEVRKIFPQISPNLLEKGCSEGWKTQLWPSP